MLEVPMKKKSSAKKTTRAISVPSYDSVLSGIVELLDTARRASARTVNAIMTATYWELGRRIVELEQGGKGRAQYGDVLLKRLSSDLTSRFGRGFSYPNLYKCRQFYVTYPPEKILSTVSIESTVGKLSTVSIESGCGQSLAAITPTLSALAHLRSVAA